MTAPDNPDSANPDTAELLQAAMRRHEAGDSYEADLLYAQVLDGQPDHTQALRLRGILARESGDPQRSLQLLQQAQTLAPSEPAPIGEIALTLMTLGDLAAAEDALRAALQIAPDHPRWLTNLGALLHHRGHSKSAEECYRRVLSSDPDDTPVRCSLARVLADAGDFSTALKECDIAADDEGFLPWVLATRGGILIEQGEYAEARPALEQAVRANPQDDMTLVNLAIACYELGEVDAAARWLQQALTANPYNARAAADLANCLCALGKTQQALMLCDEFLARHPGERLLVSARALALHNAGETDAARELTHTNSLVKIIDCPAPDNFQDLQEFNASLLSVLRDDPSLLNNPVSKSTFGGLQSGELDWSSAPGLDALAGLINSAVTQLAREYGEAGLAEHPVMQIAHEEWSLRGWGTILRAGGRQTPHMHPLGWLSGVYYVSLPDDMNDDKDDAGWLEFGRPPDRCYRQEEPPTERIEPLPGRLVLFPSWFWHRTLDFQSAADRVSIAFDVMPTAYLRML